MAAYADIEAVLRFDYRQVIFYNWRWMLGKFCRMFGISVSWPHAYHFRSRQHHPSRDCDAIYTHGAFPDGADKPVLWFYGVVDPAMRIAAGQNRASIDIEYSALEPYFKQSAAVLCPTYAFRDRHRARFPDIAERFVYVPFFMDRVCALDDGEVLRNQHDDRHLRLLFVGREYHRKGLDLLIQSLTLLPPSTRERLELDVVSSDLARNLIASSPVTTRFHSETSHDKVLGLMRNAHVFVMPSRYESYGLVYLEAMANGCAVIGSSWESQREIFDQGCGISVESSPTSIADALAQLMDRETRSAMALSGVSKFRKEFSPQVVAMRHRDVLMTVLGRDQCT